jgi:sucrose-6-phosphate hydrolase SacC (GH32 family)
VQSPFAGLKQLRKDSVMFSNRAINGLVDISEFKPSRNTYEIEAVFNTDTRSAFGFNLLVGDGRKLVISYDPKTFSICVDRTNCSDYSENANFNKNFPAKAYAAVEPENNQIKFHFLVDESSIEVFTNQGKVVLSLLTFPSPMQKGIQLFSEKGTAKLASFKGWELASIWKKSE